MKGRFAERRRAHYSMYPCPVTSAEALNQVHGKQSGARGKQQALPRRDEKNRLRSVLEVQLAPKRMPIGISYQRSLSFAGGLRNG